MVELPAILLQENVIVLQGDNPQHVNYHVNQDDSVLNASLYVTVITVVHVTLCLGHVYAVQLG